jgi:hypothetical protein
MGIAGYSIASAFGRRRLSGAHVASKNYERVPVSHRFSQPDWYTFTMPSGTICLRH